MISGTLGLEVIPLEIRRGEDIAPAFEALKGRAEALYVVIDSLVNASRIRIALPLVGWGMLSAGGYPVVLYGSLHLPEILPHDDQLHAILRMTHTVLAYRSKLQPCASGSGGPG